MPLEVWDRLSKGPPNLYNLYLGTELFSSGSRKVAPTLRFTGEHLPSGRDAML
jgi:hypothetical protein